MMFCFRGGFWLELLPAYAKASLASALIHLPSLGVAAPAQACPPKRTHRWDDGVWEGLATAAHRKLKNR